MVLLLVLWGQSTVRYSVAVDPKTGATAQQFGPGACDTVDKSVLPWAQLHASCPIDANTRDVPGTST